MNMEHKLSKEERETLILIDSDNQVSIDTSIPKDINKCKKMGYPIVRENLYQDGTVRNVIFKIPKRVVGFRSMEKRKMSEEHLERLRGNFNKETDEKSDMA